MDCFVVAIPESSKLPVDAVPRAFPEHCIQVAGRTWIVSGPETCADVAERLGIGPDDEAGFASGVVTKIADYNGYADNTLWEKLDAWRMRAAQPT